MSSILFWFFILCVFYTYIGYPLLLFVFAGLRKLIESFSRTTPQPKPNFEALPHVTLLIAAFNEERAIGQKIENSLQLDYPRDRLQILIMDDGSEDRTQEIIKSYADRGVELAYNPPRRGKMGALNRAMMQARGEVVVFSDASNIYQPNVLVELSGPFSDPKVGAVIGSRTIDAGDGALGDSEGLYWKYESFIQKQETELGSMTAGVGDIFAIRRELFEPPPDDILIDDFYMAMRLIKRGYNIVHAPKARTSERVSISAQQEIERRTRMVAGRYQAIASAGRLLPWNRPIVVWQVVSHKFLRPLVPLAMIGALLTNILVLVWPSQSTRLPVLFLAPPYNWIFFGLQAVFYFFSIMGNWLERRNVGWLRMIYLPTFLVNSNWAALKGLYRFVSGSQTTQWAKAARRVSLQNPNNRK